jgi:hypothetical protein
MRCPKCGYTSFDYNLECPKCKSDISVEQSKLNLPSFKACPPFLLASLVGKAGSHAESIFDESPGIGTDGSARSARGADQSGDGGTDIIFEEAFGSGATEELQTRSDFSARLPFFSGQREEIKDLISELMPEKNKAEPDKKMDGILAGYDSNVSREEKKFVTQDQAPEDDVVKGLEELDLRGVDLEGFGGWRALQQKKRQLVDGEGATGEVEKETKG